MPETDPYLIPKSPSEKVQGIAQQTGIAPDIADDYLKLTHVESGQNQRVGTSPKGAKGFGQVMPDVKGGSVRTVGGRQYDLTDETQNIEAGLRYFNEGGSDPTERRLHYFGGPTAVKRYRKTGKIPNISDGNMTAAQYVAATGGQSQDPYLVPKSEPAIESNTDPYLVPAPSSLRGAPAKPTSDIVTALQGVTANTNRITNRLVRQANRQANKDNQETRATQRAMARAQGGSTFTFGQAPQEEVIRNRPAFTFEGPSDEQLKRSIRSQVLKEGPDAIRDRPIAQGPVPSPADIESEVNARFGEVKNAQTRELKQTREGPSVQAAPESTVTDRLNQILGVAVPAIGLTQGLNLNQRDQIRLNEIIDKYAPGIANLDTPEGIKTDFPRGLIHGATLGAVGQPKSTDSREEILPGLTRFGAGETLGSIAPLVATEGMLPEGLTNPAVRTATTFGATGAGRQAVNAVEGRPVDLKAPIVDAAMGLVMGKLAGQDPSIKRRIAAYVAPGLVTDIAQGSSKEDAAHKALVNLGFAISGGGKSTEEAPLIEPPKASIAPVIADARSERIRANTQGAQPANISPEALPRPAGIEEPPNPPTLTPSEGAKLNRWQHRDFGAVTESASQPGVGKGRVRVLAEDGTEHIIQRPKGTGAGNQIAVPLRDTRAADEAAQAQENAPFKVIDRRGESQPAAPEPIQPGQSAIPDTASQPPSVSAQGAERSASTPAKRGVPTEEGGRSLSQAVRKAGGIRYDKDRTNRGELNQFTLREGGNLVNNKSGRSLEQMAQDLAVEGYGWGDWAEPDNVRGFNVDVSRFTEALREDMSGQRKHFSNQYQPDPEAQYRELFQEQQNQHDIDTTVSMLENDGLSAQLYDKIAGGQANESEVNQFRNEATNLGISPEHVEKLIASAREGSISEAFDFPQQAESASKTQSSSIAAQPEKVSTASTSEPKTEPQIAERSYPKTLEATGRQGGTDRAYQIIGDQESIDKANARIAKDPEAARQWAVDNLESGSSKEAIATGLRVADNLSSEAAKESDPVKAAVQHAQASELYSKAAARLTEAGQTVQAASLAQKYDPSGAALEVQRIVERVKGEGSKPAIQDVFVARDLAEKYQTANQKIGELEKRITELQQGKPVTRVRTSAFEPLKVRLDKAADEARVRLEARKSIVVSGSQSGSSAIPLDIADYAIIGAAKIAKGGLTFADWSAEMIKDFGDEVKPHLNAIFRASKKHLDEQRAAVKSEAEIRSTEKTVRGIPKTGEAGPYASPQTVESLRAEKSKLQAERRQARIDIDRHYRELERREQSHKLDAVLSLTRDSLLSVRGVLRIAMGMGGKQVLDFGSRFVKAGADVARATVTGGPRTVSAPSFSSTLRTIGGFVERAPSAIKSAVQGKPSEVMPNAYGGPTENSYVNLTVGIMQRLYAGKEGFVSSWAYPEALENNARVFALNDRVDGLIKIGQTNQRTRDYLAGKLSFEGKRNQNLAQSLANQAADYEVRTKQIIPSMKEFRAKEMTDSPTELLHSMALQSTDRAVYRQPYESKLAQKLGEVGTTSTGGKIARNIALPFSKRPANNIADNLFGYTGLRIFGEGYKGIRESINGEFGPARVKSFNDAIGKGATGFAVMAVGAALSKKGMLVSPLDKDKSKAGSLFINGKYYNVSNVPVIGWLLGMGAAYQKDGAANLPKALYRMVSEHPLLRSAKDISDMVEGLKSNKPAEQLSEYAGRQGARLIPAPVKIAGEALDTEERQTKFTGKKADITENLIAPTEASLPILRRRLPSSGTKGRLSIINPLYSKPISRRPQGRVIQ